MLVDLRRYAEAMPVFAQAVRDSDADERPHVFANMGLCLSKLNRFAEAESLFREQVLPYLADDDYTMHLFVIVLINLDKRDEAETINRQLLATNPGNSVHHVVQSKLLRHHKRFVDAWTSVRDGLAVDPNDIYAVEEQLMVMAQWHSSAKKPVTPFMYITIPNWEAIVIQALTQAPDNPMIRLLAGEVYAQNNKQRLARHHLMDALHLDPTLQPYIVGSLIHALAMQHPIMRSFVRLFRRIPESWGLGLLFTIPLAGWVLIDLATSRGMDVLTASLGVCTLLLTPALGLYLTCRMLIEFDPVGRVILSKQNKWRNRLYWLAIVVFSVASSWSIMIGMKKAGWFT